MTPEVSVERIECEWCPNAAEISITWECGHASAMCGVCFAPDESSDRGWGMDIMDWSDVPAICPGCAG